MDAMKEEVFPTKSFYSGSTKKEYFYQLQKKKILKEREKTYQSRPILKPRQYHSCFTERLVWKWFPRQQVALDYCLTMRERCLRLFSYEKKDGKRTFLVTTQHQFYSRYILMKEQDRHFYEIIRLSDHCRLYFDIEFNRNLNPNKDGIAILNIFIEYVCHCIFKEFGIICSRKDIVDLDSSTDEKFSRHLIFHLKQALFFNNINCGAFVKEICLSLKSFVQTNKSNKYLPMSCNPNNVNGIGDTLNMEDLQKLFVINSNDDDTYLTDLSVYTKNRNFRLYLSSKSMKLVPLRIANENMFEFKTVLTGTERDIYKIKNKTFDAAYQKFLDTLLCPFIEDNTSVRLLTFGDDGNSSLITDVKLTGTVMISKLLTLLKYFLFCCLCGQHSKGERL